MNIWVSQWKQFKVRLNYTFYMCRKGLILNGLIDDSAYETQLFSREPSSALLKSLQLEAPQLWGKNQVFLLLVESCRLPSNHIGSLELKLVCFYRWELRYTRNKPSLQERQKYDSNGCYIGDGNIFVDFLPHQWQFLNFPLESCMVLNVFIVRRKKPKQTSE